MDRYDPYTDKFLRDTQYDILGTDLAEVGTGVPDINVGELISRQQAIDALAKAMPSLTTPDGSGEFDHDIQITDEAFVDCMQIINELPSAQPKRGQWILDRSGAYCCSECMEPCAGYVMMKPRDKFCKMCGAKMEVTE